MKNKEVSIFKFSTSLSMFLLAGCLGSWPIRPINTHQIQTKNSAEFFPEKTNNDGALIMGVSFSGGGARAAAFGYGVLTGLEKLKRKDEKSLHSILEDVRAVSGTSGGSIIATYFAYKGNRFHDFKQRFLLQNPEKDLTLRFTTLTTFRLLSNGGGNNFSIFANWLNTYLFNGATFKNLRYPNAPMLWVTATDIYNRVSFNFHDDTFAALCSNLDTVRLADATAASSAVPVVFTPGIISTGANTKCVYHPPQWINRALTDREASFNLQVKANSLKIYKNDKNLKYISLLDGGITDNLSLSGLFLKRAAAQTPHGPLSEEQAVKLRSFLYISVDADTQKAIEMHSLPIQDIFIYTKETAKNAIEKWEFDALSLQMRQWQDDVIRFRCSLPKETVVKYRGHLNGWDCRDVVMHVERISFRDLPLAVERKMNSIPLRLRLSREDVELLIRSGKEAIEKNQRVLNVLKRHQEPVKK